MAAYSTGVVDTYGNNPTQYGGTSADAGKSQYRTDNISVTSSIMTVRCYATATNTYGAVVVPIFPGKSSYNGYSFYRRALKCRVRSAVPWQKTASMFWSDADNWNLGEMDFPESDFTGNVGGHNHHPGNPTQQDNYPTSGSSGYLLTDWHEYVQEWTSGSLIWKVDGVTVKTMGPSNIATASFHDLIQIEHKLGPSTATNGQTAYFDVDYYRAWLPA
jgi:hypothetical protein